ncbi:hypothetical protein D3C81_1562100 [compost metagenome]
MQLHQLRRVDRGPSGAQQKVACFVQVEAQLSGIHLQAGVGVGMREERRWQVAAAAEHQMQVVRGEAHQILEGGDQRCRWHAMVVVDEQEALLVTALQVIHQHGAQVLRRYQR